MPRVFTSPTIIPAHGSPSKTIEEYVGRVNSGHSELSVARMISPPGWSEPIQTPEFAEFTLVLRGLLRVESSHGVQDVVAGQAIATEPGEWVRYSTPGPEGAEYIAVCLPAFSPDAAHRESRSADDA